MFPYKLNNMKYSLNIFSMIIIINVSVFSIGVAQDQNRIKPFSGNKYYWQYNGKPKLLLGGSKDDNLFQIQNLRRYLDELAQAGVNYIRNTMSTRSDGGYEVQPFKKLSNGKYDLNQWNSEFWKRFEKFLRWTKERNIIVQIEIWDRFDFYRSQWEENAFNPKNNVNYTSQKSHLNTSYPEHPGQNTNPFFKTVPDLLNNTVVLKYQKNLVNEMLSYSLQYNHILYCIDNETNGNPKWGKYWSNHVRAVAKSNNKSIETTEMWDAWDIKSNQHRNTLDHPGIYSFCDLSQNNHNINQRHWDNIQWARQYLSGQPRPINNVKIYGANGGSFGSARDAIERFWRNLIGGIAASRFHRPGAGIGSSSIARASIQAARKLENLVKPWNLNPANHLLSHRESDEAYLAANPGEAYVLYFSDGGSVGLQLNGDVGLYTVKWIRLDTGNFGSESQILGGKNVTISTPGNEGWVAVLLKSQESLVACFSANPLYGKAPLRVNFDGSCSNGSSKSPIINYEWNFGDDLSGTGQQVHHTFQDPGQYWVLLEIMDSSQKIASVTKEINVYGDGFSPIGYYGDPAHYEPLHGARWEVKLDGGDYRYYLNTSDYNSPGGRRLGEYSLIKDQTYGGDFVMRLKAKSNEKLVRNRWSDFAVVFGYLDGQNYSYASLSSHLPGNEATGLYKVVSGKRSVVSWGGVGIRDNGYHHFELVREGKRMTLKRDGKVLVSGSDACFGYGGSLGVGSYNDCVYFDDIDVQAGNGPLAPSDLRAEAVSADRIELTWRDRSNDEEGFQIERKIEGGSFRVIKKVGTNVNQYTDSGLNSETTYIYRVCSYRKSYLSLYSNVAAGTTLSGGGHVSRKLVAHWKFDETGGSIARDRSQYNHHGNLENGASFTSAKYNRGLKLDGEDDRVSVGTFDIPAGEGLTIVAWIKADDFDVYDARIISKATSTDTKDHYWMLSTIKSQGIKLRFRLKSNGSTGMLIANSGNLSPGTWIHVAATWDGSMMRLYKNGKQVGSKSQSGKMNYNNSVGVAIGNQPAGAGSRSFDGIIDDLRLYNWALSVSEIQEVANGRNLPKHIPQWGDEMSETPNHPNEFRLMQNNPNPFNPETMISYQIVENSNVILEIYDLRGIKLQTLVHGLQSAGYYNYNWNGSDKKNNHVSSGVYIYRLMASGPSGIFYQSRKMIMLK